MTSPARSPEHRSSESQLSGVAAALVAYGWWGIAVPLYLRSLASAPSEELLVQRVVFGLPVAVGVLVATGRARHFSAALRKWKLLTLATVLIAANWFTFIHSVKTEQLIFASIGYFMNPLVSVALGVVFLGERLRKMQLVAVALGAASVAILVYSYGLPWIPIVLALSFGLYGLVRKKAGVDVWTGMTFEMALLFPLFAVLYVILYLRAEPILLLQNGATFLVSASALENFGMLLGGAMVIVPLIAFNIAAIRLPLIAVGLFQYLAPTLQLTMAVVLFGEILDEPRIRALVVLALALSFLTLDMLRNVRRKNS